MVRSKCILAQHGLEEKLYLTHSFTSIQHYYPVDPQHQEQPLQLTPQLKEKPATQEARTTTYLRLKANQDTLSLRPAHRISKRSSTAQNDTKTTDHQDHREIDTAEIDTAETTTGTRSTISREVTDTVTARMIDTATAMVARTLKECPLHLQRTLPSIDMAMVARAAL